MRMMCFINPDGSKRYVNPLQVSVIEKTDDGGVRMIYPSGYVLFPDGDIDQLANQWFHSVNAVINPSELENP